jgi:ribosomal protein L31E
MAEDGEPDGEGETQKNPSGGNDGVSREEYEQLKSELESVKSKNEELLDEVKTEREKRKEYEEEAREKQKEKARKEENIEELQEQLEQEKQEAVSEVEEELKKWKQTAEKLLVDNRLNETLDEKGVAAPYKDSLRYELRQDIEVVESDEGEMPLEAVAKNGAKQVGIDEHVDSKLEEKGAEHFIEAPQNNGGGAGSADGGGSLNENPLDQASDGFSITGANKFVRESDEETVRQKLNQAEQPIQIDESLL